MRRKRLLIALACIAIASPLNFTGAASASHITFDPAVLHEEIKTSESMIGRFESAITVRFAEVNLCDRAADVYRSEMQVMLNLVRYSDGQHIYIPAANATFKVGPQVTCQRVAGGGSFGGDAWVITTNGQYYIRALYQQVRWYHSQLNAPASEWYKDPPQFNPHRPSS